MTIIATRNGRPAYERAPERRRASVTMADWLAQHSATASPVPSSEPRGEERGAGRRA